MERKIFKDEHRIFRANFRKFLEKEAVPFVQEWEREGIVPKEMFRKMGENGYLCPWAGEEYGGSGAGYEYSAVMLEESVYAGTYCLFAPLHSDIVVPYIGAFGNEEQKRRWLPGCVSGELITAVAITEPGAGSDVAAIRATAVRDGDHYIINGQKTFISNGVNCGLVIAAVKTDTAADPPSRGVSLLCVEDGTPGFEKGRNLHKMGFYGQDTAEMSFSDCRVPAANLLGREGQGFHFLMKKLQAERLMAVNMAQSFAEAMLDMTIRYVKERTLFGKPVSSFQHNTFKIVEMATEIELGRNYTDHLIEAFIKGEDIVMGVSMAKAWIAEMANRVAYDCVQLHGGYGYMEEYPICRYSRDVRVIPIFAGTTEVMKVIVGRMLGL